MKAASRPYEAVPPEAAAVLRPALPGLADEMIAAISREVPDYTRDMEGDFGHVVRLGVEVALNRFVDLLADPEPDAAGGVRTYIDLGRGEFHAGRSLDALLAAYRVGARLAWRRFVEAGVAGGLDAEAIYALGEAIRTAAVAAGWMLPRGGVAVIVAATAEHDEPGEALLDSIAARLARRLGEG